MLILPLSSNTAGVDEAGCGSLAGPVVAAAVILDPHRSIVGLADSKTLSASQREALYEQIVTYAVEWQVGFSPPQEIDRHNILQATWFAMQRAVARLKVAPERVLIDGKHCPVLPIPARAIVKGDSRIAAISAASIIAKVTRDRAMHTLHQRWPHYGFADHKGYPTRMHLDQLVRWGVTPEHRRTFSPVRRLLQAITIPS